MSRLQTPSTRLAVVGASVTLAVGIVCLSSSRDGAVAAEYSHHGALSLEYTHHIALFAEYTPQNYCLPMDPAKMI